MTPQITTRLHYTQLLRYAVASLACMSCLALEQPEEACILGGVTVASGESVPSEDGCNTCTCSDGLLACTERACAPDAECENNSDCPLPPCACLDEDQDGSCDNTCPIPRCIAGQCVLTTPDSPR